MRPAGSCVEPVPLASPYGATVTMAVLRHDPVLASKKTIEARAQSLVELAADEKRPAKEAVLAWICASGNVIANLSDDPRELAGIVDMYSSFLKNTVITVSQKK